MSENLDRRGFLKRTLLTSTGVALGLSALEHRALLAAEAKPQAAPTPPLVTEPVTGLPTGKIGKLTVSRLICGGNLISGIAHSRNLIYVSSLMRHYFTDEKIMETLQLCEQNGINTAILRTDNDTVRILKKYWKERGGKIQWIAQTYPKETDLTSNVQVAVDNGAVGAFPQGMTGDKFFEDGHVDLIGKVVDYIKSKGIVSGVGAHTLDTPMACEEAGIKPDFYIKTYNNVGYNCDNPQQVSEFMKKVKPQWIAFKVLGAGVSSPQEGFKHAFDGGAKFINVGMYDFQVKEDVMIVKDLLSRNVCAANSEKS